MELLKCFKALSDRTRLRLLYLLQQYELNVNEIVLIVDMIQSGVSRHLKILVESRLLTSRRDGSFIYYCAADNDITQSLISLVDQSPEKEEITGQDLIKAREIIKIRQNRTKRFFKTVAPQWDRLKKDVIGDFDLDAVIIEKISIQGNISDLGCGTGELLEKLVDQVSDPLSDPLSGETSQKLIGVDSSPEMLEQARLRLVGTDNTDLRLGSLEHLPMKNQEIDTAIMNMVLHHISQPERSIAEVYRVLKPNGLFVLSDFEKHDQKRIKEIMGGSWFGFEKEKILTWLKSAGFNPLGVDSYNVNHNLVTNVFTAQKS